LGTISLPRHWLFRCARRAAAAVSAKLDFNTSDVNQRLAAVQLYSAPSGGWNPPESLFGDQLNEGAMAPVRRSVVHKRHSGTVF